MAILKPDKVTTLGGVTVNEFLLTKHNPKNIAMPSLKMEGTCIGVTIHNTDRIKVASGTTPAEQYTRATYNGNMNSVRVHYYTDHVCAWQNLPLDLSGWHAADGNGDGNCKTIAIECIMSSAYDDVDKKSEDNAARLVASILVDNGWGIDRLYTHTHWLNVRDGKRGATDELNTMRHPYKYCPAYILPHWDKFKGLVLKYMDEFSGVTINKIDTDKLASESPASSNTLYRVRKEWNKPATQLGAYRDLNNAKASCPYKYKVFDESGNVLYTAPVKFDAGQKVSVRSNTPLFASESDTAVRRRVSGTYYIYDGTICKNGRYRITTEKSYCEKTPFGKYVTGYVSYDNFE